eukprot:m.129701 g.129701  ORF g.129701 m.129701 type:complete len:436 (+) comp29420_c0_seq1:145-1452(+)
MYFILLISLALMLFGSNTNVQATEPQTCNYGDGVPVSQPTNYVGPWLTCTPPHAVGVGNVTLTPKEPAAYRNVQIFSYDNRNTSSRGLVHVSVLGLGADGGCACGACPSGNTTNPHCPKDYPGKPTTAAEGTARILNYLEHAGEHGTDLVVLPENAFGRPGEGPNCFHAPESIKPGSGGVVDTVRAVALKYKMNVVLPVHEKRDDGRQYNTAVVINREGNIEGHYSKVFPVFGNTSQTIPTTPHGGGETVAPEFVTPSSEGVKIFDLDFGRIAVLICYDINFMELWMQAEALGADIIVWPSAMQTPDPSTYGYARVLQIDIVATGFPGDIVDRSGSQVATNISTEFPMMRSAVVDIDRTFIHWDYNSEKVAQLLKDHPEVVVDISGPPFYLLRSTSATTSVRDLCVKYEIETNREYIQRARQGSNLMRHMQVPPK